MKVACLFSGGKDSTFTLYWALNQCWDVKCLVSLIPENKESYMFHTPNINLSEMQARALCIPLIKQSTHGEKEKELKDLKKALKIAKDKYEITGVIVGALYSDYQQERVNRICHELKLKTFAPLWHKKQDYLVQEMIENEFKIIIIHIASYGLTKDFLGKMIDMGILNRLKELNKKYHIHVGGEGGEFETFVVDCPIFRKKVLIEKADVEMEDENTGTYVIRKARLVDKTR